MTYSTPVVCYSTTQNGTYTQLAGIQSIVISRGRQRFQDNFPASSCVIELIPDATYATPLAIGQFIDIRTSNSGGATCYFGGKITDIERSYGIPYNTSTEYAPADRITISATGSTGALAANTLTNYSTTTDVVFNVISSMIGSLGMVSYQKGNPPTIISEPSFTGGAMDYLNLVARSSLVSVDDEYNRGTQLGVWYYQTGTLGTTQTVINFTDAKPAMSNIPFNAIDYLSSVQNSFTQVSARTNTLTANSTTGSAPYNTLVFETALNTQSDLDNVANYVRITNSQATPVPFIIRTDTNCYDNALSLAVLANTTQLIIGAPVTVQFRGVTVNATIQGITTTMLPDQASVLLYLSPSLGTPFTLNSSQFGLLDTNRLGFP